MSDMGSSSAKTDGAAKSSVEGSAPVRVQLRRSKGWRMPPNTVKVDRTTKFGNPADWRDWQENYPLWLLAADGARARDKWCKDQAVEAFREDVRSGFWAVPVGELRGKNLACWCKPGEPCHADVLLELANAGAPPSAELGATGNDRRRDEPKSPTQDLPESGSIQAGDGEAT